MKFALHQSFRNIPSLYIFNKLLEISFNDSQIALAGFLCTPGWTESGPVNLDAFNLSRYFSQLLFFFLFPFFFFSAVAYSSSILLYCTESFKLMTDLLFWRFTCMYYKHPIVHVQPILFILLMFIPFKPSRWALQGIWIIFKSYSYTQEHGNCITGEITVTEICLWSNSRWQYILSRGESEERINPPSPKPFQE